MVFILLEVKFVNVQTENLILDQYNSSPSYRVGLLITEEIVTADLDETLNDNSQGFNNYAAPGADRLKISARLSKNQILIFKMITLLNLQLLLMEF